VVMKGSWICDNLCIPLKRKAELL